MAISATQRTAYGCGTFGLMLFWSCTSYFLLYYYTDVVVLAPAVGAQIVLGATLVNGLADLAAGYWVDQVRSHTVRRYASFMLVAVAFLAAGFVAMFSVPQDWAVEHTIAYCALTLLLVLVAYSFAYIPCAAMISATSANAGDRGILAGIKAFSSQFAALGVALATLTLVARLGNGTEAAGFAATARLIAVTGLMAVVVCALVFLRTAPGQGRPLRLAADRPALGEIGRFFRANGPLWLVLSCTFLSTLGFGTILRSAAYYGGIYLEDERATSILLALVSVSALAIPGWVWLVGRTGKRTVWCLASAVSTVGLLTMLLWEPARATWGIWCCFAFAAVGINGFLANYPSILADTIEYGEWKTGRRCEGIVFAVMTLTLKFAAGTSAVVVGSVLQRAGYAAQASPTPRILEGIELMMCGIPAAAFAVSGFLILFFSIDARTHEQIKKDIASGQPVP